MANDAIKLNSLSSAQRQVAINYPDDTTTFDANYNLLVNGSAFISGALSANSISLTNKLPVAQGGTGRSDLSSGYALIGNGTNAVAFREIVNNTTASDLGWDSKASATRLVTQNTIAYWNGEYKPGSSNLSHLDTVTSGVWNATPIDISYGGTGASTASDALAALGGMKVIDTSLSTNDTLDDVLTTGIYRYTSSASNVPTNAGGTLLVTRYSSNYIYQMAFCNNSSNTNPAVYIRMKNGNGWGSWNKVAYQT